MHYLITGSTTSKYQKCITMGETQHKVAQTQCDTNRLKSFLRIHY